MSDFKVGLSKLVALIEDAAVAAAVLDKGTEMIAYLPTGDGDPLGGIAVTLPGDIAVGISAWNDGRWRVGYDLGSGLVVHTWP